MLKYTFEIWNTNLLSWCSFLHIISSEIILLHFISRNLHVAQIENRVIFFQFFFCGKEVNMIQWISNACCNMHYFFISMIQMQTYMFRSKFVTTTTTKKSLCKLFTGCCKAILWLTECNIFHEYFTDMRNLIYENQFQEIHCIMKMDHFQFLDHRIYQDIYIMMLMLTFNFINGIKYNMQIEIYCQIEKSIQF